MSESNYKKTPLFLYLALLQLVTALSALVVSLLFIKFAEGKLLDFILGFFPDVSMVNWSVLGLIMLAIQVFGNFAGVVFSFMRLKSAGNIAKLIGTAEAIWMIFQYFVLDMHNILIVLFFLLAFAQVITGFFLHDKITESNKFI